MLPMYFVSIEFAKLKVIKNRSGLKIGFTLSLKDVHHSFIIKLNTDPNESSHRSISKDESNVGGGRSHPDVPVGNVVVTAKDEEIRVIFKQWMDCLN